VLGANLGYRYYAHHLDRYYNCDWGLIRAEASKPPASHSKVA
jgi:hypothetical protein